MRTSIRKRTFFALAALVGALALAIPSATAQVGEVVELVEGTAVLLDITTDGAAGGGGGGGNGGNDVPGSSYTNIFSPSTLVDYKRFGGEPTVTIDRYPFQPGQFGCPATATQPCPPRDIVYQSAPQGVVSPRYSQFWKSDDLGQTFRKSAQFPIHGLEETNAGGGGGDSHQAVGQLTHFVYFVDLTLAPGITMNVSEDLGETWRSDPFGAG